MGLVKIYASTPKAVILASVPVWAARYWPRTDTLAKVPKDAVITTEAVLTNVLIATVKYSVCAPRVLL